ncbi:MAG: hypothetical protein ABFR32_12635 [Bacteroidota bacterium]
MDIFNLKNKTAYKFIKKHLNKAKKSSNKINGKIHTVGILAESRLFEAYDFTKKLSENFGLKPEDFKVLLYENPDVDNININYPGFFENDFGLYGKIKSDEVKNFADTKFDLLINYCSSNNLFANVLLLRSKARLKAGFYNENDEFYDISIKLSDNRIDTFNEELTRYLNILKIINPAD